MAENENLHKDHRQRMMKRYSEGGIDCFEEHEILEILLFNIFTRCNTNDISHRLLNEFKSIKGVLNAAMSDLTAIEGIGENAAARICFMGDFYRYLAVESSDAVVLDSNDRVVEFCKEIEDISAREFFILFFLDKKRTLMTRYFLNGQFNSVTFVKRDVASKAILPGCKYAVAVHNHFGNFSKPSSSDITATGNLRIFLSSLSVDLLDHLILNNGGYYCMRTCPACRHIWLL